MAAPRAYLDHNAGAPLRETARAAMLAALDAAGNASSVHGEGRAKRAAIDTARGEIAALCGARPDHVVFTSGASEAAATLLSPAYRMGRGPLRMSRLHVLATDHPCILEGGRFAPEDVIRIGVDRSGLADLDALGAALAAHDNEAGLPLVACHLANNETGVIQPVGEITAMVKQAGGFSVVDAVQGAGRLPLDIAALGADFLVLSSHKIGGPQGAGAIVAASDLAMPAPLIRGGGQEKGHRAGTENVAAIAGFGAAAAAARDDLADIAALEALRDRFEAVLTEHFPDAVLIARDTPRLANTMLFAIPGMKAETAQIAFDLAGVALSAGSACSSGKVGDSHVLAAMALGDLGSGLRISIGRETGEAELALFEAACREIAGRRQGRNRAA
ncbi:MAG: aminotransferase class V-fold PLP-dependent enzyme [Rhizobiaceae bacterium]